MEKSMENQLRTLPLEGELVQENKFELNIKQLQQGQVFKNYKALCEYLGEAVKGSGTNGQKGQLKRWQQYFAWEKQGHKMIITEVFDEVKEKEDKRKNNTFVSQHKQESFFKEGAELSTTILLHIVSNSNLDDLTTWQQLAFKSKDFYSEVGLCGDNYNNLTHHHGGYSNVIPPRLSAYVLQESKRKMLKFSQTAFGQMQKQKLLRYHYTKAWVEHVYENPEDETSPVVGVIEHIATSMEIGIMEEAMNHAFNKWNLTQPNKQLKNIYGIYTVLNKNERQKVFGWQRDYIRNIIPRYEYSYSCYEVVFVPQVIVRELINRGFDENDLMELNATFTEYFEKESLGVNNKFVEYNINRVKDRFNTDMELYNKWLDEVRLNRRGLSKVGETKDEPKQPYRTMITQSERDSVVTFVGSSLKKNPSREERTIVDRCVENTIIKKTHNLRG